MNAEKRWTSARKGSDCNYWVLTTLDEIKNKTYTLLEIRRQYISANMTQMFLNFLLYISDHTFILCQDFVYMNRSEMVGLKVMLQLQEKNSNTCPIFKAQ